MSEDRRRRLEETRHPALEFLVSALTISNNAEELDYIGSRLLAEAWTKRMIQ